MKKIIRLTEGDIRKIVRQSANEGNENLFSYCRVQPILCKIVPQSDKANF